MCLNTLRSSQQQLSVLKLSQILLSLLSQPMLDLVTIITTLVVNQLSSLRQKITFGLMMMVESVMGVVALTEVEDISASRDLMVLNKEGF